MKARGKHSRKNMAKDRFQTNLSKCCRNGTGSKVGEGRARLRWIPQRYGLAADGPVNMKDVERLKILGRHAVV